MAKISENFLKNLIEQILEGFSLKNRNGTPYLSKKSKTRKKSMTPKAIANRGKFSVNGKFAAPINKNKYLQQAWEKSKVKAGCPLNRIIMINRKFCSHDRPTVDNVITPPGGFPIKLLNLDYKPDKIIIKIKPFGRNKNEKKTICLLYICHYEPVYSGTNYYFLMDVKENIFLKSEIIFNFDKREEPAFRLYNHHIVFLCLLTLNKNGNVVRYSETVGVESKEYLTEEIENTNDRPVINDDNKIIINDID